MSNQIYNWKRFWCPRSGNISLSDGGYLLDPGGEWGRAYNPDLVTFEAISHLPCLALLGEPGSGKTRSLETERSEIVDRIQTQGDEVLFLDLRSYASEDRLIRDLFDSPKFKAWQAGTHKLHIFLDSFDECLLRVETLATLLVDEFKRIFETCLDLIETLPRSPNTGGPRNSEPPSIGGQGGALEASQISSKGYQHIAQRLYLRIACRTAVWPAVLEEGLKEIWGENSIGIYELAPLRRVDVSEAVEALEFSSDDFLNEVAQKNIVSLAIKPITLKFLLNTYHRDKGQFPPNLKLHELYRDGCKVLCEENNQNRRDSGKIGKLDVDQRLIVASRIAAVTVFANRFSVWTGVDQGNVPIEDVLLQKLCHGYETANGRKFEITRALIEEVLDTGLFSSRGQYQMGWAHQTYAEFLAAWYLIQHQISLAQITELIFSSVDPDRKLIPQLHETAAWLASMKSDVFQEIMKTDPDVLLHSDISTIDNENKARLVESLLKLNDQEKLADQYRFRNYISLKHAKLPEQLEPYILDSSKNINSRYVAINIAEDCNINSMQSNLVKITLDKDEPYALRKRAARAILSMSDEQSKRELKNLAIHSQDDPDDDLKGYALKAVYPNHMTTEEVLSCLTSPKGNSFGGLYQDFVAREIGSRIPKTDLQVALEWLLRLRLKISARDLRYQYPFNDLSNALILKAWEHIEDSEILQKLAQIALSRCSQYAPMIYVGASAQKSFKEILEENDTNRRKLLEAVISIIPDSETDPLWLTGHDDDCTSLKQDFSWLPEQLQISESNHTQKIYAKLIRWKANWKSADSLSAIIDVAKKNSALEAEFSEFLEPIDLNSPRAEEARREYIECQKLSSQGNHQKPLNPPPNIRVLRCLDQLENGSVDAWRHLCLEMNLMPTSTPYVHSLTVDLTTLPGWIDADEGTKLRIIALAREHVSKTEPETDTWLIKNSIPDSATADYQAIWLIAVCDFDFISKMSADIWRKWAAIILGYPNDRADKDMIKQELIKRAYQNAPDEFIKTLKILIDKENSRSGAVHIVNQLRCCWDERLAEILLLKVQDEGLGTKSVGNLLEELLIHRVDQARAFAESLIPLPPPKNGKAREKAIIAAQVLILYSDDAGWSIFWSVLHADTKFGREVLEFISSAGRKKRIENYLSDESMADLYIFLSRNYSG
jgi:predicted NACHT family NTPase